MLGPTDTPIVNEESTDVLEQKPSEVTAPQADELEMMAVAKSLGESDLKKIGEYGSHLKRIVEWAKLTGAKDTEDVLWKVRQLAGRIGSPQFGESNVSHIGQYIYMEMERLELEKKLRTYGTR